MQDKPALDTPGAVIDWLERHGLHLYVRPIGEADAEDAKREKPSPLGEHVALVTTQHFETLTGHREGEYLS
jgi:aromatic ring-cleaving dioxygenase